MKTGIDVLKFKAWLSGADPHHRLTALNVFWHSGQVDEEALAMTAQILQTDDEVGIRRDAVRMCGVGKTRASFRISSVPSTTTTTSSGAKQCSP